MKRFAIGLGVVLLLAGAWLWLAVSGWLGELEVAGDPHPEPRDAALHEAVAAEQAGTAFLLEAPPDKQILFGDFHVHTTFSFDAFATNMPIAGGPGTMPPADACDFARFCSQLDFWSINDHAENLTETLWERTVDAVRACNEVAGDPANPDLVTYLGWEWSHIGTTPDDHYGHKNVVFKGLGDDEIPTRPIASQVGGIGLPFAARAGIAVAAGERGRDFLALVGDVNGAPRCPDDVPVRDLPPNCHEEAATPEILFDKLNDWDLPSIVIPHGTSWGLYTPAGSDWRKQLAGHDPGRQTLIEVYSGHGNSEQLPSWREVDVAADGSQSCPQPKDGYLPSCWRAGELIEARCLETGGSQAVCASRAVTARQNYVDALQAGWRTLPGFAANDWLDAGQAPDMFQPAYNYRPRGSAQYILAIRDFSEPGEPKGFEMGFIGSSDNHQAKPGTGYKETARGEFSDGRGRRGEGSGVGPSLFGSDEGIEPVDESVPFVFEGQSPLQLFEIERGTAFLRTGGLVAVHSAGRDREAIWDAIDRKEVYATSGRRTLLWFEAFDGRTRVPMGGQTTTGETPRFRVRAAGSFEQKPGCPDSVVTAIGQGRVDEICRGECYHPSESRRPITRIEVVRIRPQIHPDEPVQELVEDPWRVLPCPGDGVGCVAEFTDPDFADGGRDTIYYVRAIEAVADLISGSDPLRCERDETGKCIAIDPCGTAAPYDEQCLSPAEPRAWSSPIFVDYRSPVPASELAAGGRARP